MLGILLLSIIITWSIFAKKELMPALQSVWFIPHIAAYIFAYAVLCCAFLCVLCGKIFASLRFIQLVKIGTISLGLGLCFGALWAKKAWGEYWSWDIKETAALVTWLFFLLYLHLQKVKKINKKLLLLIFILGFLSLQFTWFGVKYLPASKKSPHTFYSVKE